MFNKPLLTPMSLIMLGVLFLTSCEKENLAITLKRETAEKILGEWQMKSTINEEYHPIPVFSSGTEYKGMADDHYVFKMNGYVEVYSAVAGNSEVEYQVINPYQVRIGDKYWWIREHTQTHLLLLQDVNEVTQDKRYVTKIWMEK